MSKNWIDASVPLHTGMVHWPTDPPVNFERFADMKKGAVCNVSKMDLCCHAGTHMDGLNHFIKDGATLDAVPFEAVIGPCRVIEIKDDDSVKPAQLKRHKLRKGERISFLASQHENENIKWPVHRRNRGEKIRAGALKAPSGTCASAGRIAKGAVTAYL